MCIGFHPSCVRAVSHSSPLETRTMLCAECRRCTPCVHILPCATSVSENVYAHTERCMTRSFGDRDIDTKLASSQSLISMRLGGYGWHAVATHAIPPLANAQRIPSFFGHHSCHLRPSLPIPPRSEVTTRAAVGAHRLCLTSKPNPTPARGRMAEHA